MLDCVTFIIPLDNLRSKIVNSLAYTFMYLNPSRQKIISLSSSFLCMACSRTSRDSIVLNKKKSE